ncbi:MAG: hypothetical protein Cons2KO_02980 [Congregibacter sp.]
MNPMLNRYRDPKLTALCHALSVAAFLLFTAGANAQMSERFEQYELHYSVVNSTFVEPAVAAQYGISRGKRRAFANFSLREHLPDGSTVARPMQMSGQSWDLTQQQVDFDFIEVREGPAIYYIGEFKFINREWRFFKLAFTPEGSEKTFEFEFKQQMYINE